MKYHWATSHCNADYYRNNNQYPRLAQNYTRTNKHPLHNYIIWSIRTWLLQNRYKGSSACCHTWRKAVFSDSYVSGCRPSLTRDRRHMSRSAVTLLDCWYMHSSMYFIFSELLCPSNKPGKKIRTRNNKAANSPWRTINTLQRLVIRKSDWRLRLKIIGNAMQCISHSMVVIKPQTRFDTDIFLPSKLHISSQI